MQFLAYFGHNSLPRVPILDFYIVSSVIELPPLQSIFRCVFRYSTFPDSFTSVYVDQTLLVVIRKEDLHNFLKLSISAHKHLIINDLWEFVELVYIILNNQLSISPTLKKHFVFALLAPIQYELYCLVMRQLGLTTTYLNFGIHFHGDSEVLEIQVHQVHKLIKGAVELADEATLGRVNILVYWTYTGGCVQFVGFFITILLSVLAPFAARLVVVCATT